MKIIGIICEYSPFHNGHLYHLKKIKEMFPDSLIILVLNGYFLERGEISLISKENKTKMALNTGIDIVVELPFVFGTQSADNFATSAISYLENLKCDYVIFGSETNNLDILKQIVNYQTQNKNEYNIKVKNYLKEGVNYPTALAKALNIDITLKSNDLLGISYIKSIKENNYQIKPLTIKRTNDYLDKNLNTNIVSATNIRDKIKNKINISKYVPENIPELIEKINYEKYFTLLKYKILIEKDLSIYLDVDEGIHNRLKKVILNVNSEEELINKVKTKRYTYNKIRRMLIHILIGFTKEDNKNLQYDYIKVLGFNNKGKDYLNSIKKDLAISLNVNKNSKIYDYELKSAFLYDLICQTNNLNYEKNNKPTLYMNIY